MDSLNIDTVMGSLYNEVIGKDKKRRYKKSKYLEKV